MKELSIEEKAQRYDDNYKSYMELINRLEDVKNAIKKQNYGIAMDILYKPYPEFQITTSIELKESGESEDEKIRKGLIEILSKYKYFYSKEIAWLERQGEPNPYSGMSFEYNGHTFGMCARDGGVEILMDGNLKAFISSDKSFVYPIHPQPYLVPKSAMETIKEEKVDNQNCVKPADKFKPKFEIGAWIINNITKDVFLIKSFNNGYYTLEDINGNVISPCIPPYESEFHLWTIDDAKIGDVLVHTGCTFIFMDIKDGIVQAFDERLLKDVNPVAFGRPAENNDYQPATKEERDLLFQKIKELGYEWDDEKKELKNVKAKFKAGDWVVNNRGHIWKIERLLNPFYYLLKGIEGDELHLKIAWVDKTSHLWTIKDAKDGDILATKDLNYILIFEKLLPENGGVSYCHYDFNCSTPQFDFNKNDNWYFGKEAKVYPATKEQCDTLMQVMKKAGYKWNTETHELKKI